MEISMITADEANVLREKHTEVIKEIIEDIDFSIKKKAMEVDTKKEVWFNATSYNSIVISMVIEIIESHNFTVSKEREDEGIFLQITWK